MTRLAADGQITRGGFAGEFVAQAGLHDNMPCASIGRSPVARFYAQTYNEVRVATTGQRPIPWRCGSNMDQFAAIRAPQAMPAASASRPSWLRSTISVGERISINRSDRSRVMVRLTVSTVSPR